MSIPKYLEEMREIQSSLLNFLEDETNEKFNFQSLQDLLDNLKILDDVNKFKSFLYLVSKIADNHHRTCNLFCRIDRILRHFKNYIKKYFSNSEIFQIFQNNKRVLLFLLEEKIMEMDEYVVKRIITGKYLNWKYPEYFSPEIRPFINEKWFPKYDANNKNLQKNSWIEEIKRELPTNFDEMRRNGENDNYICELIRKDSICDFDQYVTKNSIPISSTINSSIYETNSYLLTIGKATTLIEYSLFFGSIQIFKYLQLNGVKLTALLWLYAIHGKNPEIIHILEENEVEPEAKSDKKLKKALNKLYKDCLIESIKCHHNDFAEYIQNQYIQNECENQDESIKNIFKYYNFNLMKKESINESSFYYICKYDYHFLVNNLIKEPDFNINKPKFF